MATGTINAGFPVATGYLTQDGITLESGLTLTYGGYTVRRGICFFNFRLAVTTAFSGNKIVLTGMPVPAQEYVYIENSVIGAQAYVRNNAGTCQLAFRTGTPTVSAGSSISLSGTYVIDGSTYSWTELPPGTSTDQLIARVAALEAKNTMQTLVDIQGTNALDGVYVYNRTPRLLTVSQERVARYGDIISMRLLIVVKAVNDSGTNTAWSCAGNSLKTICTTSLIPAFPYRVPVFDNNDQGTICGILTYASSNGNISFQPSYRIKTSGSSTAIVKQLDAGEELTIQAYATYPLKVED